MMITRSTVALGVFTGAMALVVFLHPTPTPTYTPSATASQSTSDSFGTTAFFPAVTAKKNTATTTTTGRTAVETPQISDDIYYLRRIFTNFSKAKSFRADLRIPTAEGEATGTVMYVRDVGLSGSLALPNGINADVIMRKDQIFFRSGTSSWANLTEQAEGKQILDLFNKSLAIDETAATYIPDHAVVTGIANDPEDCKLYTVNQSETVAPRFIGVCIKREALFRLTADTDYGPIEVRYRDFNANLTIPTP